jgi:hypothetical protein
MITCFVNTDLYSKELICEEKNCQLTKQDFRKWYNFLKFNRKIIVRHFVNIHPLSKEMIHQEIDWLTYKSRF